MTNSASGKCASIPTRRIRGRKTGTRKVDPTSRFRSVLACRRAVRQAHGQPIFNNTGLELVERRQPYTLRRSVCVPCRAVACRRAKYVTFFILRSEKRRPALVVPPLGGMFASDSA